MEIDLLNIRVTIKDSFYLSRPTPEQLKTYLEKTGWVNHHVRDDGLVTVYRNYSQHHIRDTLVPNVTDIGDYVDRVSDIIQKCEMIEGRTQLAIYVDIMEFEKDDN